MRRKIKWEKTHKNAGAQLRKKSLPKLNHIVDTFEVTEAYILKEGCTTDKKYTEFQDIRVYLQEK